jgi:hypothetical protein
MDRDSEKEYREEAARLGQAPKPEQEALIAWLRDIAADPKVKEADRTAAQERAHALARLLKLPKAAKT